MLRRSHAPEAFPGLQMDRFQELLEERQENKDTALTAAAVWSQVEPVLAEEAAFRDCPAPGRLRVWLKMLGRLVAEQKQHWEEEDAERFRRERKSMPLLPSVYTALTLHQSVTHRSACCRSIITSVPACNCSSTSSTWGDACRS